MFVKWRSLISINWTHCQHIASSLNIQTSGIQNFSIGTSVSGQWVAWSLQTEPVELAGSHREVTSRSGTKMCNWKTKSAPRKWRARLSSKNGPVGCCIVAMSRTVWVRKSSLGQCSVKSKNRISDYSVVTSHTKRTHHEDTPRRHRGLDQHWMIRLAKAGAV